MSRIVLSLLFCSSLLGGIEYPELIGTYLQGVALTEQEQHDRVERALMYLEGMDKEDLVYVVGYLCMVLHLPEVDEQDGCCDCCCDSVLDEMIEKEFARS